MACIHMHGLHSYAWGLVHLRSPRWSAARGLHAASTRLAPVGRLPTAASHRPLSPHCRAGKDIEHSGAYSRLFRTCAYPSDVLGHGWKAFEGAWPQGFRKQVARDAAAHDALTACAPHSEEEEMALARECCFTHYPGCQVDGVNLCHDRSRCPRDPNHWHPNCTTFSGMQVSM